MISVQASAIITAALKELNAIQAGGPVPGQQMVDGLELLNNILDDWNADRAKIYADAFLPFTIIPNHQPHTIGPAADWVTTQRPVSIEGIQVILTGGTPPYVYLKPRDAAWWQAQVAPTVTAAYPTDFYFDATWTAGVGQIYLWPVPTTAYAVQLWCRIVLAQLAVGTTISLPPGYNYALRMLLAKRWAPSLRKPWTPAQEQLCTRAIEVFEANNTDVPKISTRDAGMPSSRGGDLPSFMWPYGGIR